MEVRTERYTAWTSGRRYVTPDRSTLAALRLMIMTETMIVRVSGHCLCQLVAIVVINMIISRIDVMVKSI